MVKGKDNWYFQQHAGWLPPNLNSICKTLGTRREESLPTPIVPHSTMFTGNITFPTSAASDLPASLTGQTNQVNGLFQHLPPHFHTFLPNSDPYLIENQSAFPNGSCGKISPNLSVQKRFLVFDQTQNGTRLVFSSAYPCILHPDVVPTVPFCSNDLGKEAHTAKGGQIYQSKPIFNEVSDENHLNCNGSEMHEDTEEINALLYSDDDDWGEDDEEISTGHSPIEGSHEQQGQSEEITEEIASSNGPIKRQKLLDGGYNQLLQAKTASPVLKQDGSCKPEDDTESNCASGRSKGDNVISILGKKQSRNGMIRETLRILENIIPGTKGKDPLLVLDEAVSYLKSMKLKAKTLS